MARPLGLARYCEPGTLARPSKPPWRPVLRMRTTDRKELSEILAVCGTHSCSGASQGPCPTAARHLELAHDRELGTLGRPSKLPWRPTARMRTTDRKELSEISAVCGTHSCPGPSQGPCPTAALRSFSLFKAHLCVHKRFPFFYFLAFLDFLSTSRDRRLRVSNLPLMRHRHWRSVSFFLHMCSRNTLVEVLVCSRHPCMCTSAPFLLFSCFS